LSAFFRFSALVTTGGDTAERFVVLTILTTLATGSAVVLGSVFAEAFASDESVPSPTFPPRPSGAGEGCRASLTMDLSGRMVPTEGSFSAEPPCR
jgi:hypothetical protein